MKGLRKLWPVKNRARYTQGYWDELNREFIIHQNIAGFLFTLGMIGGFFIPVALTDSFQLWDIGIGFGLGIIVGLLYQFLVAVLKGISTCFPRWRDYSELAYGIRWRAQLGFYVVLLVFSLICLGGRIFSL